VQRIDTPGSWRLTDARLANLPAIPCLACHSIRREGEPVLADRQVGGGVEAQVFAVGGQRSENMGVYERSTRCIHGEIL
jgi:hypothetical protein